MYEVKTFNLPNLDGISAQTIEAHLGLYAGYVKHVNKIQSELANLSDDYARAETRRRLGFEFGGMKNHEAYFTQFEGGPTPCPDGAFRELVAKQFGDLNTFVNQLQAIAKTRGVGWVMCYYDRANDNLVLTWVDEQHVGQLTDVNIVLALDMWEHAYCLDYQLSEKGQYVDAFFANLNWEVVAARVA